MPTAVPGQPSPCRSHSTTRGRLRSPKSPVLEPLRQLASRSSQPRLGGKRASTIIVSDHMDTVVSRGIRTNDPTVVFLGGELDRWGHASLPTDRSDRNRARRPSGRRLDPACGTGVYGLGTTRDSDRRGATAVTWWAVVTPALAEGEYIHG